MPRPPRLSDSQVLDVIAELHARHGQLTGIELRAELARRFGHRGGVARIYRLLAAAQAPSPPPPRPSATDTATATTTALAPLHDELAQALERARLAEHREEVHQARWAGEIHALREQVHALREAAHRLPVLEREVQDRSRELAAAYKRIADLEAQLR